MGSCGAYDMGYMGICSGFTKVDRAVRGNCKKQPSPQGMWNCLLKLSPPHWVRLRKQPMSILHDGELVLESSCDVLTTCNWA